MCIIPTLGIFSILRALGIETSGTLAGSWVKSLAARFRASEMALTDSWKRGVFSARVLPAK